MNQVTRYRIRVRGHLGPALADSFQGAVVERRPDGVSEVRVGFPDQAALHGLLTRVRDLGLPLLSVEVVDERSPESAPSSHHVHNPSVRRRDARHASHS
jgi:hypothetical protein